MPGDDLFLGSATWPGDDLFLGGPGWPGADQVERWLRQRFPGAVLNRRRSAVTGQDRLSFTVTFPGGAQRHGIYVDRDSLALADGTAADWAGTIAWFLGLLPPGTATVAMRGEGPAVTPLPAGIRSPEDVTAFFDSLTGKAP